MINSREIEDLQPAVAAMAKKFIAKCASVGINIILTSTYRDMASQLALYSQGRTEPGKIVTRARPGQSYHNFRVAFDVVPVIAGKAVWDDEGLWEHIGEIGESVGLEWGGRWHGFHDRPHFQFTEGLSLADFAAGKGLVV